MNTAIIIGMVLGLTATIALNPLLIKRWYLTFPIVAVLYASALISVMQGGDVWSALGTYALAIIGLLLAARIARKPGPQAKAD